MADYWGREGVTNGNRRFPKLMMRAKLWGLAAIVALSVLPCLPAQADHWQGHEQWERKLWGTYTPGPTPSILSPGAGKPRYKAVPIITIDPSTGQTSPGTAFVPDYCGEDDDC